MNPSLLLIIIGFLYVLFFGGLSWLRREGLSLQFAIEAIVIILFSTGLANLLNVTINPVLFLFVLYLITARVRLLVDLAVLFAKRGNLTIAESICRFAHSIFPDPTTRFIIAINEGVISVQKNQLDEAIQIFSNVLKQKDEGSLGINHEAACYYNLGIAYQRKGLEAKAQSAFETVLDIMPASPYAIAALKRKSNPQKTNQN